MVRRVMMVMVMTSDGAATLGLLISIKSVMMIVTSNDGVCKFLKRVAFSATLHHRSCVFRGMAPRMPFDPF